MKIFRSNHRSEEEKKIIKRHRLLCIAGGLLLGLSFPPVPFPSVLLMFFALVPYFAVITEREKLIDVNRATYLFAFSFNLVTIYWVGGWGSETDPFLMLSGFLLLFVNPVFFLVPSTLYYFASRMLKSRQNALYLFPFFFVVYEYLYMITDASFPWVTLGNGLAYFTRYIQIADIIGALGLSLTVLFINVFLFRAVIAKRNGIRAMLPYSIPAALLLVLPLIYGSISISSYKPSGRSIRVGLIQPDLDPWDKWNGGGVLPLLNNYLELSDKAVKEGAELIIWPETALPVYLLDGSYNSEVDSIYSYIQRNNIYLMTGMPDFRFHRPGEKIPGDAKYSRVTDRYFSTYNSVLLFSPRTPTITRYGKMKLVPFGERVPFVEKLPFLGDLIKWNVGISGWNVGRDTVVFNVLRRNSGRDTVKINSLVCFESVFPDFVSGFSKKGAEMIAVVTNDSWYGNSSGPYQHKEIAALRAVENRRSVVRAANGGISAIIDPLGRTAAQTGMYTKTHLTGDVTLEDRQTFYTRHPLMIPYAASVISILTALSFIFMKLKQRISGRNNS